MAYVDELSERHGDRLSVHTREGRHDTVGARVHRRHGCRHELYVCGPIRSWMPCAGVDRLAGLRSPICAWRHSGQRMVRSGAVHGAHPRAGDRDRGQPDQSMLERSRRRSRHDVRLPQGRMRTVRGADRRARRRYRPPRLVLSERQRNAARRCAAACSRVVSPADTPVVTIAAAESGAVGLGDSAAR